MATNYSASELFTLANRIRKSTGVSQKEAFAQAKAQLSGESSSLDNKLIEMMKKGNVKFTFRNNKGKEITTTGTLMMEKVPTNRKVEGKKTAKSENMTVFYDVRHGVYRQFEAGKVVNIMTK